MIIQTIACAAVVALAAWLLHFTRAHPRRSPLRVLGWLLLAAGLGGLALLALGAFMGRFGPEHFWFRSPGFYLAVTILAGAAWWWLRQPAPAVLRWGVPAVLVVFAAIAVFLGRTDGRAMPLAMSMPTRDVAAPELTYIDVAGRRRSLAEFRGRVVLLNFWATWCTPCRREMPLLSKLQREHAAEGLVVLYVSLEGPEVLGPFLAANHFEGIHGRLDHAAEFYGAGRFYPLSFLVSRDGRIAQRWGGRPREEWLSARVGELLGR